MTTVNVESTDHIVKLANKINEYLLTVCDKERSISATDIYIACKYLAHTYGMYLGPETVKKIEKSLTFVDVSNIKGSS